MVGVELIFQRYVFTYNDVDWTLEGPIKGNFPPLLSFSKCLHVSLPESLVMTHEQPSVLLDVLE